MLFLTLHFPMNTKKNGKKSIRRQKFTPEEDEKIRICVVRHGQYNWDAIAEEFGGTRSKRQIRERWQSYLDPKCTNEWTEEEDTILLSQYHEIGPKWSVIAKAIGNKSAIVVRNRYRVLISLRRKGQALSDVNEIMPINSDSMEFEMLRFDEIIMDDNKLFDEPTVETDEREYNFAYAW